MVRHSGPANALGKMGVGRAASLALVALVLLPTLWSAPVLTPQTGETAAENCPGRLTGMRQCHPRLHLRRVSLRQTIKGEEAGHFFGSFFEKFGEYRRKPPTQPATAPIL